MERLRESSSPISGLLKEVDRFCLGFFGIERLSLKNEIISKQVELIKGASKEIDFCCPPNEINDPRIIEALTQAGKRDVNIKVIFPEEVEESLLKGVAERYRLAPPQPARDHFMVVDGSHVMLEEDHLPGERKGYFVKKDTAFLGKRLWKEFVHLALEAKKF